MASKIMIRNNNNTNNALLRKGILRFHHHLSAASASTSTNPAFSQGSTLPRTRLPETSQCITHNHRRCLHTGSSFLALRRPPSNNPLCLRTFETKQLQLGIQLSTTITSRAMSGCSQHFENESEYHTVADETLEEIQDAVEMAIEDHDIGGDNGDGELEEQPEVVYASGVLTMAFPPHGTWVLNKQTPNRQIWWSSPISGPKRFEFDPETCEWIYTRSSGGGVGDNEGGSSGTTASSAETLTRAITEEIQQIYDIELDL
jgi:frataxin